MNEENSDLPWPQRGRERADGEPMGGNTKGGALKEKGVIGHYTYKKSTEYLKIFKNREKTYLKAKNPKPYP